MPSDSNGNYSLPPQYFVQNGDTVLPVQHNPPLEDVATGLTNRLMKDGRTVMTGNLQMGGFRPVDRSDEPFATVGQLLADTRLTYGNGAWGVQPGRILEAQGFRYEVAASDATDAHVETAGGVKLKVIFNGLLNVNAVGVVGDGTPCSDGIIHALTISKRLFFPLSDTYYYIDKTVPLGHSAKIIGDIPPQTNNVTPDGARAVTFYSTAADLGDHRPMFRLSKSDPHEVGGNWSSSSGGEFANLYFASDEAVTSGTTANLDTKTDTGVYGVDVTGSRLGCHFRNVAFRQLNMGVFQEPFEGDVPYTDHVTFTECKWIYCYNTTNASSTTGTDFYSCRIEGCRYWGSGNFVRLFGTVFNNGGSECGIDATTLHMFGGWTEGGNRQFRPRSGGVVSLFGVRMGNAHPTGGALPVWVWLKDDVTVLVDGCYPGETTRLLHFGDVADPSSVSVEINRIPRDILFSFPAVDPNAFGVPAPNLRGFGNTGAAERYNRAPIDPSPLWSGDSLGFYKKGYVKRFRQTSGSHTLCTFSGACHGTLRLSSLESSASSSSRTHVVIEFFRTDATSSVVRTVNVEAGTGPTVTFNGTTLSVTINNSALDILGVSLDLTSEGKPEDTVNWLI